MKIIDWRDIGEGAVIVLHVLLWAFACQGQQFTYEGALRLPTGAGMPVAQKPDFDYSEGPLTVLDDGNLLISGRPNNLITLPDGSREAVFKATKVFVPATLGTNKQVNTYPVAAFTPPFDPTGGRGKAVVIEDDSGQGYYDFNGMVYHDQKLYWNLGRHYNVATKNSRSVGYTDLATGVGYGPYYVSGEHSNEVGGYITVDQQTGRVYIGATSRAGAAATNFGPSSYETRILCPDATKTVISRPLLEYPINEKDTPAGFGWDLAEQIISTAVIEGKQIFAMRENTGVYWYGTGTKDINGTTYTDPCSTAQGNHGSSFLPVLLTFDKLLTTGAKSYTRFDMSPWLIGTPCCKTSICVDQARKKLFVMEIGVKDSSRAALYPIIHVLRY